MASGDLTEAEWELIRLLLPKERGRPGRPAHDHRAVLNGILWRAREGARWRAVPERYGKGNTVWRRFARWRDLGVFEAVFAAGAIRHTSSRNRTARCSSATRRLNSAV
jgi:transposase